MKTLLLDIETAPNLAYVWGLFKQNIPHDHIHENGTVLCWSAKWLNGESFTGSLWEDGQIRMLMKIHDLLSESDVVIHYNGSRFDIPTLNKEFIKNGILPPAPYKQIDLLKVVRKEFRFPSNKLDYIAKTLKVGKKIRHPGMEMWIGCMNGDRNHQNKMVEYNIGDVDILEKVYTKLIPWIKSHHNHGLYNEALVCPNCGSEKIQRRGFSYTNLGRFQRHCCMECGTWSRELIRDKVKPMLVQDKN